MGTRADFYVGRGKAAEWLGSICWDGYPTGVARESYPGGLALFAAADEASYRAAVEQFFQEKGEEVSRPADGWPWPWKDSGTTDYSYAFDDGRTWMSRFGGKWEPATTEESDEEESDDGAKAEFPDMTDKQAVTLGRRSGLIVLGG